MPVTTAAPIEAATSSTEIAMTIRVAPGVAGKRSCLMPSTATSTAQAAVTPPIT